MLAILIPLSWLRTDAAGITITAAMLLAAAPFAYYFIPGGGSRLQLIGRAFEARRPALVDSLFPISVAIFLCAEIFFALGYKRWLYTAVRERRLRMLAGA